MLDSPKSVANDRRIEALLLHHELDTFNSAYAAALDEQRLTDWAEMFTDDGFYIVISRENADRNMPVGLIYCENKGMLLDRANAMKTEMFAPRYLRHIVGRCCSTGRKQNCIRSASITTNSAGSVMASSSPSGAASMTTCWSTTRCACRSERRPSSENFQVGCDTVSAGGARPSKAKADAARIKAKPTMSVAVGRSPSTRTEAITPITGLPSTPSDAVMAGSRRMIVNHRP
jgi:hypothetical protein